MVNYEEKYKKYKTKYLALKAKMFKINQLSHIERKPKILTLTDSEKITYADTMVISSTFAIGYNTTEYKKIDNMKKGLYKVYLVNSALLAVHESYKDEITKEHLKNIEFKFSGQTVSKTIDRVYGFIDYNAICHLPDHELINLYESRSIDYVLDFVKKGFFSLNMKNLNREDVDTYLGSDTTDELIKKYPDNVGIITSFYLNEYESLGCYTFNDDMALLIQI